jgi:hypothetical protein
MDGSEENGSMRSAAIAAILVGELSGADFQL